MDTTIEVTYSPELARAATGHFWRRRGGLRDLLLALMISAGFAVYMAASQDRSVWIGAMSVLLVLALLLPILTYFIFQQRSMEKLRKMGSPHAKLRVTEEGLSIVSGLGIAQVPWMSIEKVWEAPKVWLVFIGKDNYFTLPAEALNESVREYIRERVR